MFQSNKILMALDRLHIEMTSIRHDMNYMKNELKMIKTTMDEKLKSELDNVQSRYIKALEEKLLRP